MHSFNNLVPFMGYVVIDVCVIHFQMVRVHSVPRGEDLLPFSGVSVGSNEGLIKIKIITKNENIIKIPSGKARVLDRRRLT